jgi:ATP-dependent exoDNAse (exonuclease V) alpha subunit
VAALDTRRSKEAIDPAEKMVEWMNTLKETGFDIRGYREAADARAEEMARAPVAPEKTDGPDITDVVTRAIAGLSDRKVQFTYADVLARTVGQLEAKPGCLNWRGRASMRRLNGSSLSRSTGRKACSPQTFTSLMSSP